MASSNQDTAREHSSCFPSLAGVSDAPKREDPSGTVLSLPPLTLANLPPLSAFLPPKQEAGLRLKAFHRLLTGSEYCVLLPLPLFTELLSIYGK